MRVILPKDMSTVVASFGGVATTALLHYVREYRTANDPRDSDGLKHLVIPPVSLNAGAKYVYVYGDPRNAVLSLFRRDFQHPHSVKLRRYRRGAPAPIPWECTLEEYLSAGVDKFHFRDHFYNWYEDYLSAVPTMFIRYDALHANAESVLDFLDIPMTEIDGFPPYKARESDLSRLDAETRRMLDAMYRDFAEELRAMDDVQIRQSDRRRVLSAKHLSMPYLKAYVVQMRDGIKTPGARSPRDRA